MRPDRKGRQNEMKYRQWKKNYKKLHGENPPLKLDVRKQRRIAKKAIKHIKTASVAEAENRAVEAFANGLASFARWLGGAFDAAGTACRNVADNAQPIEIKGHVFSWQVREYGYSSYAVYEMDVLGGADELRAVTYSQKAAEKIVEILESDYLEHIRQTSPDRIRRRNDAADGLRVAVITAYESGAFGKFTGDLRNRIERKGNTDAGNNDRSNARGRAADPESSAGSSSRV